MRVGLVLGAGGVTGGSWLTGALSAIVEQTGWDPGSADVVVGTSAGSVIATIAAGGGGSPGALGRLGHRDDPRRRGVSAVVHGRPLRGRGLRRPLRPPGPAQRRSRPLRRR